jgi:hypothetical protein
MADPARFELRWAWGEPRHFAIHRPRLACFSKFDTAKCLELTTKKAPENRSVGGSIPPLGTNHLFPQQIQIVIFGARKCAIYSFARRSGREKARRG